MSGLYDVILRVLCSMGGHEWGEWRKGVVDNERWCLLCGAHDYDYGDYPHHEKPKPPANYGVERKETR